MIKVNITQDLGYGLTEYMVAQGWGFYQNQDGEYVCEGGEGDPQPLIDAYNPWPFEKAAKLAEINTWFTAAVEQLTAGSTERERESWDTRVLEAYGLRPLAMLRSMAAQRGISLDDLVSKVKAKAELYAEHYGSIQGRRDAVEDMIKTFPDEGPTDRLPELWALKC